MMDFYDLVGKVALGSRLRRLGDALMADAERIYQLYEVELDPRWFPVFYMLSVRQEATISELAESIGQTHPAVSQVVRMMVTAEVVQSEKSTTDARITKVQLTQKGRLMAARLELQCEDVQSAVNQMFSETNSNLWSEIAAIEQELSTRNLYDRVCQIRKQREQQQTQIVPFSVHFRDAFKTLNVNWIRKHWELEDSDYKALDNPELNIIQPGGYIAIALRDQQAVGTCALIKMDEDCYELAKMAVDDSAKGLGIGSLLGFHMIEKAKALGAKRLYLESNTILVPALNLYRKLGFKRIAGSDSPYKRCNIQMELQLSS
jgi:GNAT superfamily N-acetyltransferase/DNA-binding MarR family transcriptional regulator